MNHCNRDKFHYFWKCEPLARYAKRGSILPVGTPMETDFTSAYLHYPLPQCSKIVTPVIFSISYKLFRLPSAKVLRITNYSGILFGKLTRNNGPFEGVNPLPRICWIIFANSRTSTNLRASVSLLSDYYRRRGNWNIFCDG